MIVGVILLVPLLSAPIIALTVILIISSLLLTAAILIHKGRGGGMSDLFGGGMSTSLGGSSVAERNLDRATVIVGLIWAACIIALLLLYRSSFGV
ncbi:MAG: preprotein translocase subunit SecG [Propionibacteriaceae bacterium]|jgi:preprotein translocase subunit SecG|nr:preprotein translocase subunit SecG [Propionibacteriaceae bacterium]